MTIPAQKANEKGLLIDYEYCTDCHTCEVACQKEHGFKPGQFGITVLEYGPVQHAEKQWEWVYLPLPTDLCDLCNDRTEEGRLPTCVHHCQSGVMYYGSLPELLQRLDVKPKQVLFSR